MGDYHQQPNVRRRLSFENISDDEPMRDDANALREGEATNTPLPRMDRDEEPSSHIHIVTPSPPSSPRSPERNQVPSLRILYEGINRPNRVRLPHAGYSVIIQRSHNGYTTMAMVQNEYIRVAQEAGSETETDSDLGDF